MAKRSAGMRSPTINVVGMAALRLAMAPRCNRPVFRLAGSYLELLLFLPGGSGVLGFV